MAGSRTDAGQAAADRSPSVGDYAVLRREVGRLLAAETRDRGEAERERVARYWEVGERLAAALPQGGRAGYGDEVLARLADDLDCGLFQGRDAERQGSMEIDFAPDASPRWWW